MILVELKEFMWQFCVPLEFLYKTKFLCRVFFGAALQLNGAPNNDIFYVNRAYHSTNDKLRDRCIP